MTNGSTQGHLEELHGVEVSPDLVSGRGGRKAPRPVRLLPLRQRPHHRGPLQKRQSVLHDGPLPFDVAGGTEGATHRVARDEGSGQPHGLGDMAEGAHHDRHRRDARLLDGPRDVPDRHLTDGSDGHQQGQVYIGAADPVDPPGHDLPEPSLGGGPRKRQNLGRQRTDAARGLGRDK